MEPQPAFFWFAARQQLVVLPPTGMSGKHISVHMVETRQQLGEQLPLVGRACPMVVPVPPTSGPFTVELRVDGKSYRKSFHPGPELGARVSGREAAWQGGSWEAVQISPFVVEGMNFRELGPAGPVPATTPRLPLDETWFEQGAELLFTPLAGPNLYGPTASVSTVSGRPWIGRALSELGVGGGSGWFSTGGDPVEGELRGWPAPVTWALLTGLMRGRDGERTKSLQNVIESLRKEFSLPGEGLGELVKLFRSAPALVLLALTNLRFAKLIKRGGGQLAGGGVLPINQLLPRLVNGAQGPTLREHLRAAKGPELAFWTRTLFEKKDSPALFTVRAERKCPVEAAEAAEALELLEQLDNSEAGELLAELVPWSVPVRMALEQAEERRIAALRGTTIAELREVVKEFTAFRTQLGTHLDEVLAHRPANPWNALRDIREIARTAPLTELAGRLRLLHKPGSPNQQRVHPEPQLLVDALWLENLHTTTERALGWCWAVIVNGRLLAPGTAEPMSLGEYSDLQQRWLDWEAAWETIDVAELYRALRMKDGGEKRRSQLLNGCRDASRALVETPARGLPTLMENQSVRLSLWCAAEQIRTTLREWLDGADRAIRSTEGRAHFAGPRQRLLDVVDLPPFKWNNLAEYYIDASSYPPMEAESEALWAELLADAPSDLLTALGVNNQDVRIVGLGELTDAINRHLPEAERRQSERKVSLERREVCFSRLSQFLGVLPRPVEEPHGPPPANAPPLTAAPFQRVSALIRVHALDAANERRLATWREDISAALRKALTRVFDPPCAPEIQRRPPPVANIETALRPLLTMLERDDEEDILRSLARLQRFGEALRLRRDMLGEDRYVVSGTALLQLGVLPPWPGRAGRASQLAQLQRLHHSVPNVAELLSSPEQMEAWLALVYAVRDAGPGRRWWAALYTELQNWLWGVATRLPNCPPPWHVPLREAGRKVVVDWPAFLALIARIRATPATQAPTELLDALRQHGLLTGGPSGE